MIRVFETSDAYIEFLAGLPIQTGNRACLSFIPSTFFARDSIVRYYMEHERPSLREELIELLWNHGRKHIQALKRGDAQILVEVAALKSMAALGRVHAARPKYELGFSERLQVFRSMQPFVSSGALVFSDAPVPYTFRLYPPQSILLDVTQNIAEQTVQGLWIENADAYGAFNREFERLSANVSYAKNRTTLINYFDHALKEFKSGRNLA